MTEEILNRFSSDPFLAHSYRILTFVTGGLTFRRGMRGASPLEGIDVEELFAAVQLLAQRNESEAAAFVGSWHAMVDELDTARSGTSARFATDRVIRGISEAISKELKRRVPRRLRSTSNIDRALEQFLAGKKSKSAKVGPAIETLVLQALDEWAKNTASARVTGGRSMHRDFEKLIGSYQPAPGEGTPFSETADQMVLTLRDLVWISSPSRVQYLRPICELALSGQSVFVATLNYDNAIEQIAADTGIPLSNGIAAWSEAGEFSFEPQGISLIKLHGSIDWVSEDPPISSERPLPQAAVRQAAVEEMESAFRPAVIFGQGNKLTATGPYLELLRSFREELSRHQELIIVGYSFRDEHVNEYLAQWINASLGHSIQIIDPLIPWNQNEFTEYLHQLSDSGRVNYIQSGTGEGLPVAIARSSET